MSNDRPLKIDKLCKLVNVSTLPQFKQIVINRLKWYGIPKQWKLIDLENFYNNHKYSKEAVL